MYLLDTNICIYYFSGRYGLKKKLHDVGISNCRISEITVAELKFGVEKSGKAKNRLVVETFISSIEIQSILSSLDVFAREKARLRKLGQIIDDFDLLIGSTAIANDLILVTNNAKHLSRLNGIRIENWITG
ncbi:MAG TPA: type II toxin-antitoxin system VapC family toxin [Candidatus Kapabacteria bacterium]|nr:type II toxin-antitoxin system VapC family toxin [Candidatus Kapabacteria bacterium]